MGPLRRHQNAALKRINLESPLCERLWLEAVLPEADGARPRLSHLEIQGRTIRRKTCDIMYYTYYIILRINTRRIICPDNTNMSVTTCTCRLQLAPYRICRQRQTGHRGREAPDMASSSGAALPQAQAGSATPTTGLKVEQDKLVQRTATLAEVRSRPEVMVRSNSGFL